MTRISITSPGSLSLLAAAALFGCADTATTPVLPMDVSMTASRSADRCVNVQTELDVALGAWLLNGALVIGAPPSPMTLGTIDGWMGSVLLDEQPHGRSGTSRLTLAHVFITVPPFDAGGLLAVDLSMVLDYFQTEDRAVCALGGDPSSCRLNNRMEISSGSGMFANAGGFLVNAGEITFNPMPDRLISRTHGRVCGDGVGS